MPNMRMQGTVSQELATKKDDGDDDIEFVEMDPTKRYGRYNEILGEGACKTVFRAFDITNGLEVAWNQVKVRDAMKGDKDLDRLHSEVSLLKTLKHKNIIKFYDSWVDDKTQNVNFITEIFTSGNLRQYRRKHKHVDLKAVKCWARQILRGLLYLHSHDPPIIHRDIKCDNIFINGNSGDVKIGDLGLAVVLRQTRAAHSVIGTPEFMAPELYEEDYTELVDVYSFGMCVLELITLEYPYSECHNAAQIFRKVTSGKKPAALDKVKDAELRRFVEKCLADVSCRPPARELLKDPFLQTSEIIEPTNSLHPYDSHSGCNGTRGLDTVRNEPPKFVSHRVQRGDEPLSDPQNSSNPMKTSFSLALRQPSSENIQELQSGNLKGDSVIKLIIRLTDKEGRSRSITFTFNIEVDSALAVASEMVGELGLYDEDVIAIAEKIDSEILTLVPNWKPGAAFDESIDEEKCLEAEDLKLLSLSSNWKQDVACDDKFSGRLSDEYACMPPSADSRSEILSPKSHMLDLLSSPPYLPKAASFDSTLSFDSPTIRGNETPPCLSGDVFEAKHAGAKDLIGEFTSSKQS